MNIIFKLTKNSVISFPDSDRGQMLNASKHIPVWPRCLHGRIYMALALSCLCLFLASIPVLRMDFPALPPGALFVFAVFVYDLMTHCLQRTSCRGKKPRRMRHLYLHVCPPLIWLTLAALYIWIPY